jgi:alkylation response protein AidB-like acyl-CoA dehydrogenase
MMEYDFAPEYAAFRSEVRAFLRSSLPEDIRRKTYNGEEISKEDHQRWQRILTGKGWLAPNWSKEYGGTGWGPVERVIFDEEYHLAFAPHANLAATALLGPVLIAFGTEEQRRRFLPPILSSDDWWCQGFSEPGAGSDLAALRTRALRDGDSYVINGTKLWTTGAHRANWMFCLARTSVEEKKQAGISFILLPMTDPGVTVTPIITVGGVHDINQVILHDVRVSTSYLVGREGGAWDIAKFLLGHERLVGAALGSSAACLQRLKSLARLLMRDGECLGLQPRFRDKLALIEIELTALKCTAYRVLAAELAGAAPGPEVSVLKLQGSQLEQQLTALLVEAVGPLALVDPLTLPRAGTAIVPEDLAYLTQHYFDSRKRTILGGSSEIQKNIIARRILHI